MSPYKTMYLQLFNAITDALALLSARQPARARDALIAAQQKTEALYIEAEEQDDN